jgi:hypothetical protein
LLYEWITADKREKGKSEKKTERMITKSIKIYNQIDMSWREKKSKWILNNNNGWMINE